MKNSIFLLPLAYLSLTATLRADASSQGVVGRTIYHADKSRTESVRDPNTRELTEMTYDVNNVMNVKKVFLMNDKGEPLQGNVYDGRGNLVARCQCLYDEFGRRKEDRLINLNGETFQQVIHEYGKDGKALTPKVINLNANAPTIKPAAIDFTQPAANPSGTAPNNGRFAPAMQTEGNVAPVAPVTPPSDEKAKPNFFKRLFQKKDK